VEWANTILQGVLLGGLYALFAASLWLSFRVMRLANVAQGDLMVLGAYLALVAAQTLDVNPLLSLVVIVPAMAIIGYLLQRGVFNLALGDDLLPPLIVMFGLSVLIQNGLLEAFGASSAKLNAGPFAAHTIAIGELAIGALPLAQFVLAVVVLGGLHLMFGRTALGRAFRAASDDGPVTALMGLNNARVFGLAMALSLAIAFAGGVMFAIHTDFDPAAGPAWLIFGFEAMIIGGLGNIWGALAGGVILGVAQSIGAQLDPGWSVLAGHIVFLLAVALRPQGLFSMVWR
jgi:branched-chain amino acid transport system permease protein